jgi:NAD(P)-dependent dehydrogenase (short-subunit alcohol dehydrogenase family)
MDLKLTGKLALITGSTAGIGLAIATSLAAEGATVIINGRTKERVTKAIQTIKYSHPSAKLKGAIADFSVKAEIDQLTNDFPTVDILVNNIGIFEPIAFVDILDEDWYRMFDVNVMSGVRLSRHYFPHMMSNDWGRIVFISSESGVQIPEEMIHYGMTKTAQIAVANGLAKLTKGSGVTVNSVLPGSTMSEGASNFLKDLANKEGKSLDQIESEFFKNVRPNCLLQRFATTEEVANMVTYLCSPLASATNGAAIRVDGGTVPTIL